MPESTGKPAARVLTAPASPPAAAPRRARPAPVPHEYGGRPYWMERMAIPLTGLSDPVLASLERLGPSFLGWGIREDEPKTPFFVDVGLHRFKGASLLEASVAARARVGGALRVEEQEGASHAA